jgi:hypothetical protein
VKTQPAELVGDSGLDDGIGRTAGQIGEMLAQMRCGSQQAAGGRVSERGRETGYADRQIVDRRHVDVFLNLVEIYGDLVFTELSLA